MDETMVFPTLCRRVKRISVLESTYEPDEPLLDYPGRDGDKGTEAIFYQMVTDN
jgi:hypothetical protein